MEPVIEEPDLRFRFAGRRYGCAVKRMGTDSDSGMEKRYRQALRQIARAGLPGFVCMDVEFRLASMSEPIDDAVSGPVHAAAYYQKLILYADAFSEPEMATVFRDSLGRGYSAFLNIGAG